MVNSTPFEDITESIKKVLNIETNNFFELTEILNLDLRKDFVAADLSSVDLYQGDLTWANLESTNLRGANLAFADLSYANLKNADLGFSGSGIQVTSDNDTCDIAHNLIQELAQIIALLNIADPDFVHKINMIYIQAIALKLATDLDFARNFNFIPDISFAVRLALDLACDLDIALSSTRFHVGYDLRKSIHRIISTLWYGANLYKADLTGANLEGTNVEGAIFIACRGLSKADILGLSRQGAITSYTLDNFSVHALTNQ